MHKIIFWSITFGSFYSFLHYSVNVFFTILRKFKNTIAHNLDLGKKSGFLPLFQEHFLKIVLVLRILKSHRTEKNGYG
jgi:hypothetical protein